MDEQDEVYDEEDCINHVSLHPPIFKANAPSNTMFSSGISGAGQIYSPLQLEPTFWGFPYKMTQGAMVENHLKFMLNPPIFSQMLVLMWEAYQWVLVPKFSMVFELQAFKFESTKKSQF